jgi:hypothetical protein
VRQAEGSTYVSDCRPCLQLLQHLQL